MTNNKKYSLGIVGVRGYVGKELLELIAVHPNIEIQWVSSRQLEGKAIGSLVEKDIAKQLGQQNQLIENLSPADVATKETDIVVLALPNGLAEPFVQSLEASQHTKIIIDLSADYRFDKNWIYSVPELDQAAFKNAISKNIAKTKPIKISNPGCYATAMQLALAPIIEQLSATAHCFGVSGYSGAGTKPSPNNDPDNLKDNLIAYALSEHLHETEVSVRMQQQISFTPHVAAFFRGINMTIQVEFSDAMNSEQLLALFNDYYKHQTFVSCQSEIPVIKQVINTPNCIIGGFKLSSDGKRATFISCLDNLLKGAASQALQNINIALNLTMNTGLE